MPQYRIEISPNNRAGCKDTVCKAEQVKILKGEVRFGTWVEIDDHGSWGWKHWGCVSGSQMVNLQEACDQGDGTYDFDTIDGYDELNDHPEIQEKIRRCVEQGHIDPQDFKGDPEKNKPGEKGIRLTAKQKAAKEKAAAEAAATASEDDSPPKKKAATKRGRKKANVEDDDEEPAAKRAKPAKTSKAAASTSTRRKAPAKKQAVEEDSEADVPDDEEATAKKPRRSSGKTKETPKARVKAGDDTKGTEQAKRSRRVSRAAAKSLTDEDDVADSDEEPAPKSKGKRGRKAKGGAADAEADAEPEPAAPRRGRPRRA